MWTKVFADGTVEVVDIVNNLADGAVEIDPWSRTHKQTVLNQEGSGGFEWFRSNDGDLPENPEDCILKKSELRKAGFNDGTHEGTVDSSHGARSVSYLLDNKWRWQNEEWVRACHYMTAMHTYWGVSYGYGYVTELGADAKGMDLSRTYALPHVDATYQATMRFDVNTPEDEAALWKMANGGYWAAAGAAAGALVTGGGSLWVLAIPAVAAAGKAGFDYAIDRSVAADYTRTGPKVHGQIYGALLWVPAGYDPGRDAIEADAFLGNDDTPFSVWRQQKGYVDKTYPISRSCTGGAELVGSTYIVRWVVDSKVEAMSYKFEESRARAEVSIKSVGPLNIRMMGPKKEEIQ